MEEIFKSIGKWFQEKKTSSMYGTFIISIVLWNWKFFYVLFWQNQDALNIPKIEYAIELLNKQNCIVHLLWFLIFPTISMFIIILILPYFNNWLYKKTIRFEFQRKNMYDTENKKYEENKLSDLKWLSSIKEEQANNINKINKNTPKEEQWINEFKNFKTMKNYPTFILILDALYKHNGYLSPYRNTPNFPEILAFSHSLGLIDLKNSNNQIDLTEKGKFFALNFIKENNLTI